MTKLWAFILGLAIGSIILTGYSTHSISESIKNLKVIYQPYYVPVEIPFSVERCPHA